MSGTGVAGLGGTLGMTTPRHTGEPPVTMPPAGARGTDGMIPADSPAWPSLDGTLGMTTRRHTGEPPVIMPLRAPAPAQA